MCVPFLWYRDNCAVLAHKTAGFRKIVELVRDALEPTGWRFLDDMVELQANRHVPGGSLAPLANKFRSRGLKENLELLGRIINVVGNVTADFQYRLVLARAGFHKHHKILSAAGVSRKNHLRMMF